MHITSQEDCQMTLTPVFSLFSRLTIGPTFKFFFFCILNVERDVIMGVSFGSGLCVFSNSSFYTMFVRFLQLAAEWAGKLS